MADKIPTAELVSSGGRKIPLLGFGTATFPLVPFEETKAAVLEAIKLGYRHFDTAAVYLSEEPIGQAIKEALELGLVNLRDEFFITSKLWCTDAHPGLVIPALQKSLEKLKLEYLDLYLIHWPVSMKPGVDKYPIKKENLLPMDFKGVWADMEECQRKGLTKSIGLSNFSCKKVGGILANAKIPPAINQICLRWAFEYGACVLAKSFNKSRMKENLAIFDWELTEEELQKISEIPQTRVSLGEDFIYVNGPYKTIEEFWDGE
ncbi:NADPH-dependent codeinone reductase 1-4-like isoform X2 [Punica granatum]|uniref:NADPH-dependent codeinone reductase 1-4-like isoform X2 n=1 Tax=Punica granatum TaxID=22663 RepID=A0A6P8DS94_PUNGR|nr:NADPH-dependent codeinone reductase 1-4-like isoform X2 [Punica granatum]